MRFMRRSNKDERPLACVGTKPSEKTSAQHKSSVFAHIGGAVVARRVRIDDPMSQVKGKYRIAFSECAALCTSEDKAFAFGQNASK